MSPGLKLISGLILISAAVNPLFAHSPGRILAVLLAAGLVFIILSVIPFYLTCYFLIQTLAGKFYIKNRWIKNLVYWIVPLFLSIFPTLYVLALWIRVYSSVLPLSHWFLLWLAFLLSLFLNIKVFIRRKWQRIRKARKSSESENPEERQTGSILKSALGHTTMVTCITVFFIYQTIQLTASIPSYQVTQLIEIEPGSPVNITKQYTENYTFNYNFVYRGKVYDFEGPEYIFIMKIDRDTLYAVSLEETGKTSENIFACYRLSETGHLIEIDSVIFPRHLAVQNCMWESPEEWTEVNEMDLENSGFRNSLTAMFWVYLETETQYYKIQTIDTDLLKLFKSRYIKPDK